MTSALRIACLATFLATCGSGGRSSLEPASPLAPPKPTVLNSSLASPWGMAFLPDGRLLVTQKAGTMVILAADGSKVEATVSGVPEVVAAGQALWRVELNGNVEASREQFFASLGERIRAVRQGPDGWIYLLADSGKLIRIER